MSIETTDLSRFCNTLVDKQANAILKEILGFLFLDATSSFVEEPCFQNSE